jgi:hypothetical protein
MSAAMLAIVPDAWKQQRRWFVWRDTAVPGQLFNERRLYGAVQEYPGLPEPGTAGAGVHRSGPLRGKPNGHGARDLALCLWYLADRPGVFAGVAYLHEGGDVEYFPIEQSGGAS